MGCVAGNLRLRRYQQTLFQLEGEGELAWLYSGLMIFISVQGWRFRQMVVAEPVYSAAVFSAAVNYDTQQVELYNGSTLLGSYATSFSRPVTQICAPIPTCTPLRCAFVETRSVFIPAILYLALHATVSGFAAVTLASVPMGMLFANCSVWATLDLSLTSALTTFPDGSVVEYGRIDRSNAVWDEEFQVFTLTSDVEEISTRSEDISLDYEFYHSDLLALECGNDSR